MSEELELRLADGRRLCRARVARTFGSRFRGLMGAAELPAGRGLLLPSTSSVHTHFMRFPIDVVFLDADRRVLRLVPELRPWRFAAAKSAAAVLELAAGECARVGLAPGDVLTEL
jgi:hypothetical protein